VFSSGIRLRCVNSTAKEGNRVTPTQYEGSTYQAPELKVLGTLHELTLGDFCFLNKTFGSPDFWNKIPIANCSG
jgi:hypothetical protein